MFFHLLRILTLVKSRQFSALRLARGSLGSVYSATELCPLDIGYLFRRTSTVEREERSQVLWIQQCMPDESPYLHPHRTCDVTVPHAQLPPMENREVPL